MTDARELFARYLAQRRELGEGDLLLDPGILPALSRARPGQSADEQVPLSPPARQGGAAVSPQAPAPPPLVTIGATPAWGQLHEAALGCFACGLSRTRTTVVFGDGDPSAQLVVVGEAPGADEDRAGRPFVGRAGKLLDLLLASIGYPRDKVYICNVLKCRPPNNRNPAPDEVELCSPFLHRQIELIGPKAILAVGTFSAQTLLGTAEPIGRLRGIVHEYRGIPLVPTYHPAALLRNPSWIRPVWGDLQRLRSILDAS